MNEISLFVSQIQERDASHHAELAEGSVRPWADSNVGAHFHIKNITITKHFNTEWVESGGGATFIWLSLKPITHNYLLFAVMYFWIKQ